MTTLIDDFIARLKTWPAWRQRDAADLLEMLEESGTDVYRLSKSERAAVREGLQSHTVSDEELEAFRFRNRA